ncbi:hypothetical protein CKO_01766 [Citrobacter koseri ATCC BAA-895]|uniref:Uncharacterized protein n=1 Tax=Citrobacter koseri (strain ATCC BAA-895 / CDC 4225-83 / SGSC4696) TaxID=290338 RepID=A8AHD2_CITK8|nr:hypothetical protein CKO_01766 [Citrobacter koseri ATCC BAA-895]
MTISGRDHNRRMATYRLIRPTSLYNARRPDKRSAIGRERIVLSGLYHCITPVGPISEAPSGANVPSYPTYITV